MTKRILVVEDQIDARQIVRDLLTANDYTMTEAENGEKALAAVAKDRPDLILTPGSKGRRAGKPITTRHLNRLFHEVAEAAGIKKA